jgi:nucleotide-binding universal stress UspA family protein
MLGEGVAALKQKLDEDANAALAQLIEQAKAKRKVKVEGRVLSGPPLETILEHAAILDAELLVLGAQGESFLRRTLLGSTASRLLRRTFRQPVLVVKQMPHEAYCRLLVAVDFSSASLQAIQMGRRLAPQAEITLLHALELPFEGKLTFAGVDEVLIRQYVQTEREQCQRRLHELAAAAGLVATDYSALVLHGNSSQHIITQEQELDCDLIVLSKHGSHLTEELLLGSVTQHVLVESQGDVLVFADERLPRPLSNDA